LEASHKSMFVDTNISLGVNEETPSYDEKI
jgi:hypothetical protein